MKNKCNKIPKSIIKKIFINPIYFFAFGFGTGLLPFAPGTFGTLVGVVIYLLLHNLHWEWYLLATIIITILGIWVSDICSKAIGVHDHTGINVDEIVGFLWTMVAVPFSWRFILFGFLLFRLFDIWKPWPIRWLDKNVGGGLGMVLDDFAAAFYSWVVLQVITLFFVFR